MNRCIAVQVVYYAARAVRRCPPLRGGGWAYLCFERRRMRGEASVARHRRYAGPPSGRRGRRPATSAIRVRITTGSYPLHCSARTPLFLFFVFFSLLIFPSLSRFLVSNSRAQQTRHTRSVAYTVRRRLFSRRKPPKTKRKKKIKSQSFQ